MIFLKNIYLENFIYLNTPENYFNFILKKFVSETMGLNVFKEIHLSKAAALLSIKKGAHFGD